MGAVTNGIATAAAVVSIATTTLGVGPSSPSTATNNGLGGTSVGTGSKS